ncbi:FERM, ARHGEF and pleckstrin domain-containing protein 1-like isoform X3 [Asterias amurensis]|uniref:FERM, ARHGEF and pleckstrin domain-containing protein 1-like isoform X3 n=1 Tax=Asterias amurensis TaxID=7602 RepID=UPI003AB1DBA2
MNTYVAPEGPHCGSGNDSMAALSQVSGGNHTYAGSSHDQLNDREASYSYGYNYTPTGTPTHSYSTADRTSEHHSLGRDSTARGSMRKGGKLVSMKVQMLDDSVITLDVPNGCLGMDLFKECCRHLNLLEMDYFGLEYFNKTDKVVWLDLEKPIARQVLAPKKTLFHFTVKFYLADPGQLHDEFTKYLYALQIKKDLSNGRLPCSENTAALMASYMLQAEVGDFSSPEHDDGRYITAFRFVPNQTRAMESKIQEYHKNHIGQTPADADFNLLDVARRLEMYGVRLHAARDYENVQLQLAVSHQGVLVFHNNTRINTFSWAKIRKLSFKRKRFLVKLHPEGFVSGYPRSTVEFMMSARNECKRFWKTCVEHHTFFRLTQSRHGRRPRRRLMSRGSTFRYSGRTQKQVVEDVRVTYIQRPGFGPSVSRVSTRSLGAPRTTTPLTIQLSENVVPDHHSAPDLSYGDEYPNGQGENAANSPTSISPTTPSSTPATPVHDNSRIAIHKGNSNSSITYEYTVNEDSVQVLSSPEQNGETVHLENESTTEPESEEAAVSEDLKPKPEPMQELEVKLPVVNGDHNNTEGLNSPLLSPAANRTESSNFQSNESAPPVVQEEESGVRKKRHTPDRAYFIAKEILTTERTYLKDLEVIVVWFRKSTTNESSLPDILETLFNGLDPIYEFHCKFMKEIETRLTSWEGRVNPAQKGNFQRVGDIMLKNVQHLKLYQGYIAKLQSILQDLETGTKKNKGFENFYKDFELQKVCYLPFNTFLVKPMQRLLHYQLILERLIKHYPSDHPDYKDCKAALSEVNELTGIVTDNLKSIQNYQKLTELQRDLVGFDSLLLPGRNKPVPLVCSNQHFIREGCLHKLSRKGYQQRMFFLFSDILVYTSKGVTPTNQFKVHGQIPLKGVVLEDSDHNRSVANCVTLYGTNKTVVIAASTPEEKERWMADLRTAMALASNNPNSPESNSTMSDPESSVHEESEDDVSSPTRSIERQSHHRANTTVHVCWHRNTSVSMADHVRAMENQLSGFLLRKFKNSNGWQKLWVVFTNFCLFFYKIHQDDYPLASLPLLGYSIMFPTEEDDIRKDYVFKLQFKTHVYFFRAESEYTFSRWLEVLKSATFSSKVEDLF